VSDQFYLRNPDAVVPTFVGVLVVTILVQTVTGAIALYFADLSFLYKMTALGLYVSVSVIWVDMLFLSATKDYANIVIAFALGYLTSFLLSQLLSVFFGLDGLAIGFLIGQVLLMSLLMHRVFAEYHFGEGFSFEFLTYFKRFPALAISGCAYNTAIWIDKILFWYSDTGVPIHSYFRTHFPYDSAMFIAYVTILPTLAIFLLRIETDFYLRYKNYYGTILQKAPLALILQRKAEMMGVLRQALKAVLIWQGVVTMGSFLLMPFLVSLMGIDPADTPVFRVATIGSFFHGGLLILLILVLYFDFRGSAVILSLLFLVLNVVLTLISLRLGPAFYGFGYTLACAITLAVGFFIFNNRIKNLEYLTFMRQPVG
jgi:uncharacterized membrane protein